MKLLRARAVCHAPNRYWSAASLHRHFVVPHHGLYQKRFASSAQAPVETGEPVISEGQAPPAAPAVPSEQPAQLPVSNAHLKTSQQALKIRRVKITPTEPQKPGLSENEENLELSKKAFTNREEYEGVNFRFQHAEHPVPYRQWPYAVIGKRETDRPDMARLSEEIRSFYQWARPSEREMLAREAIVDQMRTDLHKKYPNHTLEVFGSERTGLALALSDIDVRIISQPNKWTESNLPIPMQQNKEIVRLLLVLMKKAFRNSDRYWNQKIVHGKYPLLHLQHRKSGLDVQVLMSTDTAKSRECIEQYLTEFPCIREVYTVIKVMLEQRGLTNVHDGGFGSYTLFMMLVASMQQQAKDLDNPGITLMHFLEFWSKFDTRERGVSVSPPGFFDKKEHPVMPEFALASLKKGALNPLPPYMLCLRDPADPTNDLGRKASSILHLQKTLENVKERLEKAQLSSLRSNLLWNVVGHAFALTKDRRKQLSKYGLTVQKRNEHLARQENAARTEGYEKTAHVEANAATAAETVQATDENTSQTAPSGRAASQEQSQEAAPVKILFATPDEPIATPAPAEEATHQEESQEASQVETQSATTTDERVSTDMPQSNTPEASTYEANPSDK